MKKYIFSIISASLILGLVLLGAYYRWNNIISRAISVWENWDIEEIKNTTTIFEMLGISKRSYHEIGIWHAEEKSWFSTVKDGVWFLTYWPYTQIYAGYYQAIFELQIDNHTADSDEIVRIEIYDPFKKEKIAEKIIARDEFRGSLERQNFVLPFEIQGEERIVEFRVYVFGKSYVEHFKTTTVRVDNPIFTGSDPLLTHQIGNVDGSSWKVQASDGTGYITRWPYIQHLPADVHTASFQLEIGSKEWSNDIVAELEIFDTKTQKVLQKRIIKRSHFYEANTPQDFDVEFEILERTLLELRIMVYGRADITHHKTQIYSDKVTMNDIWEKTAYFEFYDKKIFLSSLERFPELWVPNEPSTGPIVTLDGVWYSLNRQRLKEKFPGCTKNAFTFRTVVRKSVDQWRTWSEPVLIDPPTGPTDGMCNGTDGSMYFDLETGIWHFITQCIPKEGGWWLCHYTRDNISPMGLFTPNPQNPVVRSGELFQKLCAEMGEKCPDLIKPNPNNDGDPAKNRLGMIEEWTPHITEKYDGYFYVTYHGAHYQTPAPTHIIWWARAVARTKDFINWEVTWRVWSKLPNDIMLSRRDCGLWMPNGEGGAGVQIRSGGFNYALTECPDRTIAIIPNQEWPYWLSRHPTYGKTGTWGTYPHNPFVISSDPLTTTKAARLQYGKLFRDRWTIYMATLGKIQSWMPYWMPLYVYRLTPGTNGPLNYRVPGDSVDEDPTDFVQGKI